MKNYLQDFLYSQNNLTNLTTKNLVLEAQQIEQLPEKKLSRNNLDDYLTALTTKFCISKKVIVKLSNNCQLIYLTTKNLLNLTKSITSQTNKCSCQVVKSFSKNTSTYLARTHKTLNKCKEKGGCFRFRLNWLLLLTIAKDGKLAFFCHYIFNSSVIAKLAFSYHLLFLRSKKNEH